MQSELSALFKTDMFERINRGSDLLRSMEKRKGIYPGEFKQFLYDYCVNNNLSKELVQIDKWLINRQEYEELLLRFFALTDTEVYMKGINIGIAMFLDSYLEKKNNECLFLFAEVIEIDKNRV